MFVFIIVVILLILAFLWYMWFLQKKNNTTLISYKSRATDLKEDKLKEQIKSLEDMKLTGASLESFGKSKKDYSTQRNDTVPKLLADISNAESKNANFNVFGASSALKNIESNLTILEKKSDEIASDFEKIVKSNEQNASTSEVLHEQYEKLRKDILTKSFNYGPATDRLESELNEIAGFLDQEDKLTQQGDHLEARQYLDDAKVKLGLIEDQVQLIVPLYHGLSEVYPGQIEEIESVLDKLIKQQYKFAVDIGNKISTVHDNMEKANEELSSLNFDAVDRNNEKIHSDINELYDELSKEINSKRDVLKQQKPVLDYLNHAKFQHNRLDENIQKLEQNYVLNEDDMELFKEHSKTLSQVREEYDADVQSIADKSIVFSNAEDDFKDIVSKLDNIEAKEKTINDNLNQMLSSEQISRRSVEQYAKRIEIQKKIVEQLRLNGLPEDYLEYFYMVSDEIKKLYDELDSERVNMEDISKQVIVTQEDLENLVQKTDDLRRDVALSEKLLQYANRYADKDAGFKEQLVRAKSLFDDDFDYEQSLKLISEALEQVEPGSVSRIKDTISA
ncbi:septation ring formation regulator EzrA [Companilactobacillus mishanensis]|uniref:septation ring formation regulator EzrA n=1 Tax=Companilactobacillus mishanensis TaxID=2486008 RepID=UPI001296A48D|nr:septation ring formation regulator EzrA [Companilactobacillus mishanensis]MQS88331.1 selenide, water dikinase [Companilactobacillus mishanensis]